LPPVWLFSDDLEEFFKLLQSFGGRSLVATNTSRLFISPVEKGESQEQTSAEQQGKEDSTVNPLEAAQRILADRSPSLLYAKIPDRGISILILPTMVELRRLCDWRPGTEELDAIPQLHDFLRRKHHWLFLLGQREWQLYTALVSIMLMLLGLTIKTWVNNVATVLGACLGGVVIVWAIAGIFMPNRSHLTLWHMSRTKFKERLVWGGVAVLAISVAFLVGMTAGRLLRGR
jgi:hypothetical protein